MVKQKKKKRDGKEKNLSTILSMSSVTEVLDLQKWSEM